MENIQIRTEASMTSIKTNGQIDIVMSPWAIQTIHFCIREIRGGYKDMTISDTAVDLTAKFGLTASEFTATFDGVKVADVTAFVPNKAGTLSVTVKKAGYSDTNFTINVVQGE